MNENYRLKGVKQWVGTDGYGFVANLYKGDKKVCQVVDTADGSPMYNPSEIDDLAIEELVTLYDLRKEWIKHKRKGYDCMGFNKERGSATFYNTEGLELESLEFKAKLKGEKLYKCEEDFTLSEKQCEEIKEEFEKKLKELGLGYMLD